MAAVFAGDGINATLEPPPHSRGDDEEEERDVRTDEAMAGRGHTAKCGASGAFECAGWSVPGVHNVIE